MKRIKMKNNQAKNYKWAYLPFVFSSAAILVSTATAAPYGSQQYQPARQVNSVNHEYVGGRTQAGISVTDDGDIGLELNHAFSETKNSSSSVGLWADYDVKGDDKGIRGRGVQLNHNWVSSDKSHVNKVTAAYDRNANGHDKATLGYGQETESMFWEGHVSKGLSGRKSVGHKISDKAYDYGVGGSVGTFLKDSNMRVRAGLDHEWSDDVGVGEKDAKNTTLSAGVEKFFQGTPHSLGLDVAASKKSGGLISGDDTDVNGRLSYRYDFGGASIYQPDRLYKRVRVEVPGKAVAPRYAQQRMYKRVPTYKTVPTYGKKTIRKPYKQLVKSTMGLEGQTFFKLNSAKLIPSAQNRLKQIATQIRKNGYKGAIRITGNTCGLGDAAYDQRLSEQRAQAVRNFLIQNGFNANHLVARGLGKAHPKFPNTPEQGFKNRRVDIEYVSERKAYKTGYRTETQNVRTGTRRVATGFKNVPAGTKNVIVSSGRPGSPRVVWRTEVIPTSPAWIKRALHNNIKHDRNVNTFTSTDRDPAAPVNTAPVANNDAETYSCGTGPRIINLVGNDTDANGDALTISSINLSQLQYGTAVINQDRKGITYTPNPNGSGCGQKEVFDYTVSDGNGGTDTATVTININAPVVNTAPVAANDSATISCGTSPRVIGLTGNDTDADGDMLAITHVDQPQYGTAVINADGTSITYTPDGSGCGKQDTFNYTISDGNGGTATATVTVNQSGSVDTDVNADDDAQSTDKNTPVVIDVLSNDDSDATITRIVRQPSNGTVAIVNGQIRYTPNNDFTGTDTFEYEVRDAHGNTDIATVTVTVNDTTSNGPEASDDSVTLETCSNTIINVLANDNQGSGNATVAVTNGPSHGSAEVLADGAIKYTPNDDYIGDDSFQYTITDSNGNTSTATVNVTVTGQCQPDNEAPVAVADTAATQCDAVTISVLNNDNDPDSDTLSISGLGDPSLGTAIVRGNTVVYTPVASCGTGTDTFSYTISDGHGHEATANISVDVQGCDNGCGNDPINVANDRATTQEGTGTTVDVLANDDSGLMIASVSTPANGYVEILSSGISYLPKDGFSGTDSFTYTVKNSAGETAQATVTVKVKKSASGTNYAPVAVLDSASTGNNTPITIDVLANDTDPESDTLTIVSVTQPAGGPTTSINNGKIRFDPKGVIASSSFSYTISDGHGNTSVTGVTVGSTDPNSANIHHPLVVNDVVTTKDGVEIIIAVLANDSDDDGDTLILDQIDSGNFGETHKVGNKILYKPIPGMTGTDTFYYGVHDGHGHNGTGLVTVHVTK